MKLIKQVRLFAFLVLIASCSQNTEEIILKLDKKVGDEQIIVSSTETSRGALMSMNNNIEVLFKVSEHQGNMYTLTSDVLAIKTEIKMGDDVESYDSKKEESKMTNDERSMHAEFKDILDSEFTISMDERGNIVKPFHYANGNIVEGPIVDMSNIQIVFPETKVKVGTTWENEKTNPLTAQKTKSIYKIKNITDKEIIISVSSTITGISGLLNENKATGEYILDKKTCNLIKGTLEMNLQAGGKVKNSYYIK